MSIVRRVSILVPRIPVQIAQCLQGTTGESVVGFCRKHGIAYKSTTLHPPGGTFPPARLFHIEADTESAGGVLFYAHGGGYISPTSSGSLNVALALAKSLGCRQLSFLEYSLAPAARYPSQLAQGVEGLKCLLEEFGAASVVIAGDSAGANLMLGLLAHLRTPHPDVRSDIELDSNLAAVVCISPRCSNAIVAPSFQENGTRDVLSKRTCQFFVETWQPVLDHVWAASNNGDASFWSDVEVDKILVLAGEFECYIDDIKTFANLLGTSDTKDKARQFHIARGAIHDQVVLDHALKIQGGSMDRLLFEWAGNNRLPL
ncbi:alpha/beta-hydrolase [Dissoconium aciculare CBS 342.82]|uniref:Alpha/beta-hydrolase n=1 Tax=Dissoconium aciculare CBS 342.82 TaxID=1314786 RepID=A0A6J3LSP4_9PEZI|nr:alpha/beta-hydrolase [Dissoconium aciculare CBS 342.82]KAF1818653.1 alpha/beta-hydrolase [Dissoconium aciculare CBS 342.82]